MKEKTRKNRKKEETAGIHISIPAISFNEFLLSKHQDDRDLPASLKISDETFTAIRVAEKDIFTAWPPLLP